MAALAAHAAVVAWLAVRPAASVPEDERRALTVRLTPPADPVPPQETAPANEPGERVSPPPVSPPAEVVTPPAEKPKRLRKPTSRRAPSQGEQARQKPKEDAPPAADANAGAQDVPEGTAVYRVSVGAGGIVQSITLARSSGVTSYDAAGVDMIRSSMTFDPPPSGSAAVAMIVTIDFSPLAR